MDKKLARKNLRAGLIAGGICFFMFGATFAGRRDLPALMSTTEHGLSATDTAEPRQVVAQADAVPPAGEDIHLPGGSPLPLIVAIGVTLLVIGTTIWWVWSALGFVITGRLGRALDPRRPARRRRAARGTPPLARRDLNEDLPEIPHAHPVDGARGHRASRAGKGLRGPRDGRAAGADRAAAATCADPLRAAVVDREPALLRSLRPARPAGSSWTVPGAASGWTRSPTSRRVRRGTLALSVSQS